MANDVIFSEAILPCSKRSIANRLVKVAMYEHLAGFLGSPPNSHHISLYAAWAEHNWGMIITGNVQVSARHLTLGRDVVVPKQITQESSKPFRDLAASIHSGRNKTLAVMQLNHSGRQSSNFIGGRLPFAAPMAPSAVPLRPSGKSKSFLSALVHSVMFQTPRPMTSDDIEDTIESFVRGAVLAEEARFDGVQLHVAHGYLLSEFLDPKTNLRKDEYSADEGNALRVLHRIVTSIRGRVKENFILGIKLNSGDYVGSSSHGAGANIEFLRQRQRALIHVRAVCEWNMVDFIEISGGDYQNPDFMTSTNPLTTRPRQAFFADFSSQILQTVSSQFTSPPLILLTGGLRSAAQIHGALSSKQADLVGLGRASVLAPDFPSRLLTLSPEDKDRWEQPLGEEPDLSTHIESRLVRRVWEYVPKIKLIGAGVEMAWYSNAMRELARGGDVDSGMTGIQAVFWMWFWLSETDLERLKSFKSRWTMVFMLSVLYIVVYGVFYGISTLLDRQSE